VFGWDASEFSRKLMECPEAKSLEHSHYDLVLPAHSSFAHECAGNGWVPDLDTLALCNDKAKTAETLGGLAPETLWVRDTHGSGGKGAQMASEYLPGRNFAVEMFYTRNGLLMRTFQKERISYKNSCVSDAVMGTAKVATCTDDPYLRLHAVRAVSLVSDWPNGVYTVDFKENKHGKSLVTEINAGKFATSSYVFYGSGYNMPLYAVNSILGEGLPQMKYPLGQSCVRGMDSLPWVGTL